MLGSRASDEVIGEALSEGHRPNEVRRQTARRQRATSKADGRREVSRAGLVTTVREQQTPLRLDTWAGARPCGAS